MKSKAQADTNLSQGSATTPKSTPKSTPKATPKSTPGKRKRTKTPQDPKTVEVEIQIKKEKIESIKKEEPVEDSKVDYGHLSDF